MNMPGFKNALNRYIFTIIFYTVILLRKVDLKIVKVVGTKKVEMTPTCKKLVPRAAAAYSRQLKRDKCSLGCVRINCQRTPCDIKQSSNSSQTWISGIST